MMYQEKGTTTSNKTSILWLIGIFVILTIASLLSMNYDNPYQPKKYEQQFTPLLEYGSSMSIAKEVVKKTHPILNGIYLIFKFIGMTIGVLSLAFFVLWILRLIADGILIRFKLFKIFGVFRSSSLADINL